MVSHGGSRWLGASIAGTSTASSEMAKGGEGVEGIQCSSAASVWAKVVRSTSARSAVEWRSQWPLACGFRATARKSRCSAAGSARSRGQAATSSRSVGGHFRSRGGRVAICLGEGKEIVFRAHGRGADHGVQGVYRSGREACGRFGRSASSALEEGRARLQRLETEKYRARVTLCCHHQKILCPR